VAFDIPSPNLVLLSLVFEDFCFPSPVRRLAQFYEPTSRSEVGNVSIGADCGRATSGLVTKISDVQPWTRVANWTQGRPSLWARQSTVSARSRPS
jgi:hypothetical protein